MQLSELQRGLGDGYRVERELGGGGMSQVFVATEVAHDRKVVVKVLSADLAHELSLERFRREIRMIAQLQHPHLVPLLTSGEIDGLPYFTMPFVEGESLRARLTRSGAAPIPDALRILREIASALGYAHQRSIVHRDVKPDNVLLSHGVAMLADLGVARALSVSVAPGERVTATGMSIGTPAYVAPEQAAADPKVDHRADIYAWGAMAYELLTGAPPFAGRSPQATLAAHMTEVPESIKHRRPAVSSEISALVMRCLEKDPSDRPQTATELVQALDAVVTPRESRATPVEPVTAFKRPSPLPVVGFALVLIAVVVGYVIMHRTPSAQAKDTESQTLAVLPFAAVGADSTRDYFADGMTDELADALARIPGLRLAARRSAFAFKGKTTDLKAIGKSLGVALLLDGSVRRDGERVRVTAQLSKTSDGLSLWTSHYDGDAKDVFALQDSIATAIVRALRLTLNPGAQAELATVRTRSVAAHDLYMQGRSIAEKHTEPALREAIDLFQRSIAADSTYPLPWIGIADAYGWMADGYLSPDDAYPKAKAAAQNAIRLAPSSADAHAVLAWDLYAYDYDLAAAERESERAVALDSTSALAHSNYAFVLMALNRLAQSAVEARKAARLEPLSAAMSANLEWNSLMRRQYDSVIVQHERTKRLDPTYYFGDSGVGAAYRELGRYPEAVAAYEAAQALEPRAPLPGLAITLARMRDNAGARALLTRLEASDLPDNVRAPGIAAVYANLNDHDHAMEWLERALKARSHQLLWLRTAPEFDPLRVDPRFDAFLKKVVPR